MTAALGALVLATALGITLPSGAPAGQSSQATSTPVPQIAVGVAHSCAALPDANLRCWGFSGDGQLGYGNLSSIGDDETPATAGPVSLGAGRTVRSLAAGEFHSCAVLDNGTVRCWGFNYEGQLGTGSRDQIGDNELPSAVSPVNIGTGRTATAITAGGRHTCALLDGGDVRCWGLGDVGQLGYGNTATVTNPAAAGPVDFGTGRTALAVTAGTSHTCAILDDRSVRCWGLGSTGQLGYGNTSAVFSPSTVGPVDLGAGRTARAITAGEGHTCAVLDDFSVRCWGLNDVGQLGYANKTGIGDNETPGMAGPVNLGPGGRTATAISAGTSHTCAVLDDGTVRCWGQNANGQLGYGNTAVIGDTETPGSVGPVDLGPGRTARAIAGGTFHTCARLDDGGVRCWGFGGNGRTGLCNEATIGDNETPGSVERVDIGAGGAACPTPPAPPAVAAPAAAAPAAAAPVALSPQPAPPTQASGDAEALREETRRANGLRSCRASVQRQSRSARTRALRRYRAGSRLRTLALRQISRRAAQGRVTCLTRFGRRPGRVHGLAATASAGGKVVLTFRAAGSDASKPPAARRYLIKQALRPMRTMRDFQRAPGLCKGACTFDVTTVGSLVRLEVTRLRPRTTYYYKVSARDNVSGRIGPRSATVRAKTR